MSTLRNRRLALVLALCLAALLVATLVVQIHAPAVLPYDIAWRPDIEPTQLGALAAFSRPEKAPPLPTDPSRGPPLS